MTVNPAKITPRHLERLAIVYVRQSTPMQVRAHQESKLRQYALSERARDLGWPAARIQTIDVDLGVGASRLRNIGVEAHDRKDPAPRDAHSGSAVGAGARVTCGGGRDASHRPVRDGQVELYVTPTSPYARLAMIVRLEKGLDEIDLVWTRTRNPDDPMLAFNPSGRIPFLRLDDGTGFEDTDAIVDYMDPLAPPLRFTPPGGEAYWPSRRRQATARSMLEGVALWAREIMRPEGERSPTIVEHERRRAARLADFFEAEIDAFAGPLDMPQLLLFCALDVEHRLPAFDWRTGRRGLVAWHARVAALPSVAGSLPPTGA